MADKDRIFHLFADESIEISKESVCNDQENRETESKTNTMHRNKDHQHKAQKMNVFERNYQYARIYENKRCALKAEKEADAISQRYFKASPMPIVQSMEPKRELPKFTIPDTPEVLKHSKRTPRT